MAAGADVGLPRAPRGPRTIGSIVAIALLVAAVGFVIARWDGVARAVAEERDGPVSLRDAAAAAALAALVAVNVGLSGAFFRVLLSRFGRVGLLEMQAVVAAATLINYLPLRPGIFARLAYHRQVNAIPIPQALRVVLEAVLASAGVTLYLVLAVALPARAGSSPWPWLAGPVPLLAVTAIARPARTWALAILIRYVEVLLWAVRMWLAFALLGHVLSPLAAVACAGTVVVTSLVPFTSNGLGLTEWSVGLLVPFVAEVDPAFGVAAQFVNRAAELIVITLLGIPAFLWTSRRLREA